MQRYHGSDRDSGIDGYEAGVNYMRVRFIQGGTYLYTYRSAGKRHIDNMKLLAKRGTYQVKQELQAVERLEVQNGKRN